MTDHRARLFGELNRSLEDGRDLEAAILAMLPISIIKVGQLSLHRVYGELQKRAIPCHCELPDRSLRGCLVAFADNGLIFIDSTDSSAQQRFTLAHETAHFVVDYLEPRQRAQDVLGADARDLIDGDRPPTNAERINAVLSGVPIGFHLHTLGRGSDFTGIDEIQADDVAFELLAPSRAVYDAINSTGRWDRRKAAKKLLIEKYGFPSAVASIYARSIFPEPDAEPLRAKLGL